MKIQLRQQVSIAFLALKPVFYKMLALFGLSAIGQTVLFYRRLQWGLDLAVRQAQDYAASTTLHELWAKLDQWPNGYYSFSQLIDESMIHKVFLGTLLVLALLVYTSQTERGSIHRYTLQRLTVHEKVIFWNHCLCYTLCFAALILFETLLCFGFGLWYEQTAIGMAAGPQGLFLGFWQSEFLHALLPMADTAIWIRNLVYCLCLGTCAALFSAKQRRAGKVNFAALLPLGLVWFFWGSRIGDTGTHAFIAVITVMLTACGFIGISAEGGAEDEG